MWKLIRMATELSKARDECNSLIVKAMNSRSKSHIGKRDWSCAKYKAIKNRVGR